MTGLVAVETRKLVRSRVVAVASLLQVVLIPLLALLLVRAEDIGGGVLAAKGQALVVGEGWAAYTSAFGQVAAAALFVGAGVVVAWVFGREHADRTFGALFALPVSRGAIARAKLVVVGVWGVALGALVVAAAVLLGALGGVGEAGRALPPLVDVGRLLVVTVSTMLLAVPVAFVASVGRGYLPAIGAVVVVLATAQISVFLGAGAWFPWTVPGLYAVADGSTVAAPGPAQVVLAVLAVLGGCWTTVRWWDRAEVA